MHGLNLFFNDSVQGGVEPDDGIQGTTQEGWTRWSVDELVNE